MATITSLPLDAVAGALSLRLEQVESVVALLDAGNTVPFITRYRKDQTGGLDEEEIRQIQDRVARTRMLADRKQTILRSIESQGALTPELAAQIEAADTIKRLEDLYLPYKPRKQTLATTARQRGLELLANEIETAAESAQNLDARASDFVNTDKGVPTAADALLGAGHILAERYSERAELRHALREIMHKSGKLASTKAETAAPAAPPPAEEEASAEPEAEKPSDKKGKDKKGKDKEKTGKGFRDYFEYREDLSKVPPHRVLAINRGENAKILRVRVEADFDALHQTAEQMLVPADHPHADFLRGCVRDALDRLVLPSLEREARRELTDKAETHAVHVFARNLRNLLLQPPIRGRRVLAIDPGFKSGCKAVALDEFGKFLEHTVIHLVGSDERKAEARTKLIDLVNRHELGVFVIGNGTACRETEMLAADLIQNELAERQLAYVIVNEAGASVYSTSTVGREEFPEFDATLRGAISIGRRLQDPLSELVKIDPANIGVGLYQHDVKAKHLRTSLDEVVESCVNYVGVDLNTASAPLLRYVSGLNQLTSRRLFDFRSEHGPFKSREQLKEVPGFGEATFVQAAGFLRISGGDNPLDGTWIHPESYQAAQRVLEKLDCTVADLADKQKLPQVAERVLNLGSLLLKDILAQLTRPGRDPREDLPKPIFKREVLKLEDLAPSMELTGSVLNVVDFGAFVDIGLKDSGLVHVSRLSRKFVTDPHEVVSVGDIVRVWVVEVDKERRRVSLTMVEPGTERPHQPPRRHTRPEGDRPAGQQRTRRPPRPAGAAATGGNAAPAQGRPPHKKYQTHGANRPKPKPKPAVPLKPLTKGMKEGKEPMRTFGDLKQFFEMKHDDPEETGKS
jgi:uncharacterized protein